MINNEEFNIDLLRDAPKSSRAMLDGVENHYDAITAHVVLMHQHMSSLLAPLTYGAAKNTKIKDSAVKDAMVKVIKHLLALCEACEYELPSTEELLEGDDEISWTIKNDSILMLTDMMMSALDIIHVVHVDLDGMTVWAEEAPSGEMAQDIKMIILGIRNLGKKHNFTLNDIISEIL